MEPRAENTGTGSHYVAASLGDRFRAALYDVLASGILAFILPLILLASTGISENAMVAVQWFVLWQYFALSESLLRGQTVGKRQVGLFVLADDSNQPGISYARASLRFVGKLLIVGTGLLGLLMVAFDRRSRALDDLIARTRVCRVAVTPASDLEWTPGSIASERSDANVANSPSKSSGNAFPAGGKWVALLLQVLAFFVLTVALYPYMGSTFKMPGDPVPGRFPVISMVEGGDADTYRLTQWSSLSREPEMLNNRTLNLPIGVHAVAGLEAPESVGFTVTSEGPKLHVSVRWRDDNYNTEAEYAVVNGQVVPERMTLWHAMNLMATLALAGALAVAIGWLWRNFSGAFLAMLHPRKPS